MLTHLMEVISYLLIDRAYCVFIHAHDPGRFPNSVALSKTTDDLMEFLLSCTGRGSEISQGHTCGLTLKSPKRSLSLTTRSLIIIFAGVNFTFLVLEKTAIYYLMNCLRKRGYHKKPVIIVETGKKASEFIESIKDDPDEELEIVGFIAEKETNIGNIMYGKDILGDFSQLKEVLHRHPIDEVVFALPEKSLEIGEMLRLCEEEGVTTSIITDFPVSTKTCVQLKMAHNLPLLTLIRVSHSPWQFFLKWKRTVNLNLRKSGDVS